MKLSHFLNKDGSINKKEIFKSLKRSEHYDYFTRTYQEGFSQPSKNLSKLTGIDLHTEWNLPMSHIDLELLIIATRDYDGILKELYDIVVELNPTLESIELKSEYSIYELLLGVTSQFNKDDIEEFIGTDGYPNGGTYYVKMQCPDWSSKVRKLETLFGPIQYVPSYKTLNHIFEKLKIYI